MKVTEKKRILQINSVYGVGSTGRIVEGIKTALEENGYTGMIAYGRGEAKKEPHIYRIGSDLSVNAHGALSRLFDNHGQYSVRATRQLIEKIREWDPHLIHLHNIHGYYLNTRLLFQYLKGADKQIIWTLHDCWPFTGHCTHFEYIGCTKWQEGCYRCEQLLEYPKSLLRDRSRQNYQEKQELFTGIPRMQLVTPSRWLAGKVGESFLKEYQTTVIPTGIDLETFRPTASGLRKNLGLEDRFVVLGVANPWRERKGLYEFHKLSDIISDKFKIILIGLNEKQLKELPANIIGVKKTDSVDQLVKYYSMADALVDLTFEDTFPTTHLEALACGTPVLTYQSGGSTEMLDASCGMAVKRANIRGMEIALETVRIERPFREPDCLKKAAHYGRRERFQEYVDKVYDVIAAG